MAVFAEVTENVCIIYRHLRDIDSLSDSVRPHIQYVVVSPDSTDGAAVLLLHG